MRQLISSSYISLDGVVESPHMWPSLRSGSAGEGDRIQTDLLEACDVVLMGRRTYDVFAPAWSSRHGDPYSDRINAMRKVVASTTLGEPTWANTEVAPTTSSVGCASSRPRTAATSCTTGSVTCPGRSSTPG